MHRPSRGGRRQGVCRPDPPYSAAPVQIPNSGFPYFQRLYSQHYWNLPPVATAPASGVPLLSPFSQNPSILHHQAPPYVQNPLPYRPQAVNPCGKSQQDLLGRAEAALEKAHCELLAAGESVSAWKVSQSALVSLQVDSWASLGFQFQDIPYLRHLVTTEGKVNAFIHCFVGVWRITSLHDLDAAICKNEGIEQFDALRLGPLLQHPLVFHYFSIPPDTTEVPKITADEIICCLSSYEFLSFLMERYSVSTKEKLGVRIQSLGNRRNTIYSTPNMFSEKKVLDRRFGFISKRIKSFSSACDVFEGKHIKFDSSGEDDSGSDSKSHYQSSPRADRVIQQRVSSCPYPSTTEEIKRLGLKTETDVRTSYTGKTKHDKSKKSGRKRKYEAQNLNGHSLNPVLQEDLDRNETEKKKYDITFNRSMMHEFVTRWKEACRKHTAVEVLDMMANFYVLPPKSKKKSKRIFSLYPGIGLLNVAIASIKYGMLDTVYDSQNVEPEFGDSTPASSEDIGIELPVKKDALSIKTICAHKLESSKGVTVDDIIKKITSYFQGDYLRTNRDPPVENKFPFSEDSMTVSFGWQGNFLLMYFVRLVVVISPYQRQKATGTPNRVYYSTALLGKFFIEKSNICNGRYSPEAMGMNIDVDRDADCNDTVSAKDAIECLLKVPMLSDLQSWSHWDLVFAPKLGPLLAWLSKEVHNDEISCIALSDGRLIRIDHSANVDEFLEASIRCSPFHAALKLLSLLALYGGTSNIPVALLKCYSQRAMDVIIRNCMECQEISNPASRFLCGSSFNCQIATRSDSDAISFLLIPFVLDCLNHIPSEFHSFAVEILMSGLRSSAKDGPLIMLRECKRTEQRIMLHDIGLSLGIVEWIEDYHLFKSATSAESLSSSKILDMKGTSAMNTTEMLSSNTIDIIKPDVNTNAFADLQISKFPCERSDNKSGNENEIVESRDRLIQNAALVIESIRREEFGLDPSSSCTESSLLKKQHARLGRALYCLSQELYSQDSHLLLELVQNADDNTYSENVEPTLVFILHPTGIVILNNERGFSAENIRALCDIGNSTKKGSSAGYIGQKGIGFKSVFRITDAPEIHSNGFHVKFDISEGQIGFVLPTVISPCDIRLFERQLSSEIDQDDASCWNTCIVLPFRSKLKERSGINSIMSMFSDLHPSLLLFLHRLECIKFKNILDDSLIIMRKDLLEMALLKRKLQASVVRPGVQMTEIAVAFTLQESDTGEYVPYLSQQPAFAFLPLRTYGLKFILQGDFVLPSSREEVDGNSAWNQWLLSEFPTLFVNAETSFTALSCFKKCPGKAVSAFMSFVPLVGEVHGFFAYLPQMIVSKLRSSSCLLLEGHGMEWVPPCNVLREASWPWFLGRNIALSDSLAKTLGIREYGPQVLIDILSSICHDRNEIQQLGFGWLSDWLLALSSTLSQNSSEYLTLNAGMESDVISDLRRIPFIPLSDGTYGSTTDGPIWLPGDSFGVEIENKRNHHFPCLYAKLRTVNLGFLSLLHDNTEELRTDVIFRLLHRIGVQELSAHEVIISHILPDISAAKYSNEDKNLMVEYLSYVMLHFQNACSSCQIQRMGIVSALQKCSIILTNHGYKCPAKEPLHFSQEFGNPFEINKLIEPKDDEWNEVDDIYLKHYSTESTSSLLIKWRKFFQELGVSDFVQVIRVEKHVKDLASIVPGSNPYDLGNVSPESQIIDWESPSYFGSGTRNYVRVKSIDCRLPHRSSFLKCLHDFRWIGSTADEELHYPKDLFYDCEQCDLHWVHLPHMLVTSLKLNIMDQFKSHPLIFVPSSRKSRYTDTALSGTFLSSNQVYWHDPTGCLDQVEKAMLCSALCGVPETPPFGNYIEILLQLSSVTLPSQAAHLVFQVFIKWSDDIKSGRIENEEIVLLRESLRKVENMVLPTMQNRWVSLHPSFGIQFKHSDNVNFIQFGELSNDDMEILSGKLSTLLQKLGIVALSEIISREAIFYGSEDSREKVSFVNWALPYAQRYLFKLYPDRYIALKKLGAERLPLLQIVVVEKLFYRYTIKGSDGTSRKRSECSCLLQDNVLYMTRASDSHSIFLELSRIFFNGSAELHFANFLHMIATMAESGSTEGQTEFFIVNSQKVPALPVEEPVWSISTVVSLFQGSNTHKSCPPLVNTERSNPSLSRKAGIAANWPPTDWKTAPDFSRASHFGANPGPAPCDSLTIEPSRPLEAVRSEDISSLIEVHGDWVIEDSARSEDLTLHHAGNAFTPSDSVALVGSIDGQSKSRLEPKIGTGDPVPGNGPNVNSDDISLGSVGLSDNQSRRTGVLGEAVAYKYFSEKLSSVSVKWVNQDGETGLPYDLVIEDKGHREFVEVKATRSATKDWFPITTREWQFAAEKGDSYSIAHISFVGPKNVRVTVLKNPLRLCQQNVLCLALLMRKQ
ncbi:unnamed protein product [Spirodela intermedia]|uniref:Uncharacterized protein n=1 Tax=Spirodela intermedia TaxID=51605 RepID=A0A7I8JAC6_SPIIN|nr:unnamed protein product [Spirodela intermedia]CAA6667060.1 unnamed protein product [Spirodela intermedia]